MTTPNKPESFFPDPLRVATDDVALYGGKVTPPYIIAGYKKGYFPWGYLARGIPEWWNPDPRCVLYPEKIQVHHAMKPILKDPAWEVTISEAFMEVVALCGPIRPHSDGTWLEGDFLPAYDALHQAGLAHSIEVWYEGTLAGGLFGIITGKVFSGESMFHLRPNASKIALIALCSWCREQGILLIDCQQDTRHLRFMGAELISRNDYIRILSL